MSIEQVNLELMDHLFYLHKVLHQHAQKIESDSRVSGITVPQRIALGMLIKNGSLSLKELSLKIGLSHSTVSGIIDRLERKGMVKRIQNPEDRRFTQITVTDEVKDFVQNKKHTFLFAGIVEAFKKGTQEEQARVIDGLTTLRQLLEKED